MGHFSMEIYAPTGSNLSGNQQQWATSSGKTKFHPDRDFVPSHFSDAYHRNASMAWSCRRLRDLHRSGRRCVYARTSRSWDRQMPTGHRGPLQW